MILVNYRRKNKTLSLMENFFALIVMES